MYTDTAIAFDILGPVELQSYLLKITKTHVRPLTKTRNTLTWVGFLLHFMQQVQNQKYTTYI